MTDQPTQTAQQQTQQIPIRLDLTLAEVNGVIQCMRKAPYEMSQPLIDKVTKLAQDSVNQMAAQQQPMQQPAANQVAQMPPPLPLRPSA